MLSGLLRARDFVVVCGPRPPDLVDAEALSRSCGPSFGPRDPGWSTADAGPAFAVSSQS